MKTAIVWIEYQAQDRDSIETYEYAEYGESCEYATLKEFLDSIKNLARTTHHRLKILNVVTD